MFLPPMVCPICPQNYILCERGAEFQLNTIPITYDGLDDINSLIYFPRPFIIVALTENPPFDSPQVHAAGIPYWPKVYTVNRSPAIQNTNKEMFINLFLELALSTMYPYDPVNFPRVVNYLEPGIQQTNYRGYFTKYLSDNANSEPRQWLNTFIQAESIVKEFMSAHSADLTVTWNTAFHNELLPLLRETVDQRMFGAPGVYSLENVSQTDEWFIETFYIPQPEL